MLYTRQHITYKLLTLLVTVCLVLPTLVKLSHTLEHDHEHNVCIEKDQVHFHDSEYDCEFYKFNLNHNLVLVTFEYEITNNTEVNTTETSYYSFLNSHQQSISYLRGPPLLM